MPAKSQRKFFDKVIEQDLNPMCTSGILGRHGQRVDVRIFGQVLDLKGREKFLDQTITKSYMGCAHCQVQFDSPGPMMGCARRYLDPTHPLRRQLHAPYEFRYPEIRGMFVPVLCACACGTTGDDGDGDNDSDSSDGGDVLTPPPITHPGEPKIKDTIFVHNAANRVLNGDYEHYFGQKGFPMFWKLSTYSYENMNIPDKMHNVARLTTWIMNLLVGPHGNGFDSVQSKKRATDRKHREQSKRFGVFRSIWPDSPVFLNDHRASILRGKFICMLVW